MSNKKGFAVAYDIVDDRKRARVLNILKDFGMRVQKSVFECRLDPEKLLEMQSRLSSIIDSKEDSVLIYPLCRACITERIAMGSTIPIINESGYLML